MRQNANERYFVISESGQKLTKAIPLEEAQRMIQQKLTESQEKGTDPPKLSLRQYLCD